jgi:hypothetical protein
MGMTKHTIKGGKKSNLCPVHLEIKKSKSLQGATAAVMPYT